MRRAKRIVHAARRPQLLAILAALVLLALSLRVTPVPRPPKIQSQAPAIALPVAVTGVHPASTGKPGVDCAKMQCLVLSFDDGPNPITTPQILTILEQNQVRADFFVVGLRAATMPEIVHRAYIDGDEIGNHSWSHPDLTTLTPEQVQAQVAQTQQAVIAAGVPAPHLFRPPYGAVNAMVKSQIHLTFAMWNVDPQDWNTRDANQVAQKVIAQAKPGGVIDMHDIDPVTVAALPAIIQNFKARFQLVTMSEMFNLAAGQRGEFFGR
ncbi:MAG TPA: polysaccharide deacetylase family protein [Candidatus Saccharimonadales bacterium]|nr:polysaccharide deacetylase family protein [Candidatus Saccharimonadales bacterium]